MHHGFAQAGFAVLTSDYRGWGDGDSRSVIRGKMERMQGGTSDIESRRAGNSKGIVLKHLYSTFHPELLKDRSLH